MDDQQNLSHEQAGSLCTKGCGFFGSPAFSGMCSQCHKSTAQNSTPMKPPRTNTVSENAEENKRESNVNDASGTRPEQEGPFKSDQPTSSGSSNETSVTPEESAKLNGGNDENIAPVTEEKNGPRPKRSKTDLEKDFPEEINEDVEGGGQDSRPGSASKKTNRCKECRRKVGLTGYQCRCGGTFCSTHRYSDIHKCDFDYKQMGTEEIRKNNPLVKGDKIRKL